MKYVIYCSRSLVPHNSEIHNEILRVSQKNNAADRLTGFLHREGDYFLQYLEGPKEKLFETVARIGRDPRHTDFQILKSDWCQRILLPNWSMGYVNSGLLNLGDLLETDDLGLKLRTEDPFDLIVFLVNNAQALRESALAG
mgnify:CR=1 FL=1